MLLLPLDDLLVVVREFIEPCLSRSALDRCLRRHGVSDLRTLQRERDGDKDSLQPLKRFKAYEPGFVHIDVKYLPKMQDEASRKYLFVAIDRTTRWVYLEIRKDKRAKSAQAFKRVFDIVKDFGISESPKSFTISKTRLWIYRHIERDKAAGGRTVQASAPSTETLSEALRQPGTTCSDHRPGGHRGTAGGRWTTSAAVWVTGPRHLTR